MELSADDPRFQVQTGAVQSIAISGGRDDSGLFAADHRDERYLPFEGSRRDQRLEPDPDQRGPDLRLDARSRTWFSMSATPPEKAETCCAKRR